VEGRGFPCTTAPEVFAPSRTGQHAGPDTAVPYTSPAFPKGDLRIAFGIIGGENQAQAQAQFISMSPTSVNIRPRWMRRDSCTRPLAAARYRLRPCPGGGAAATHLARTQLDVRPITPILSVRASRDARFGDRSTMELPTRAGRRRTGIAAF
jgi:hypothetical protein